jgi:hypothetical protein
VHCGCRACVGTQVTRTASGGHADGLRRSRGRPPEVSAASAGGARTFRAGGRGTHGPCERGGRGGRRVPDPEREREREREREDSWAGAYRILLTHFSQRYAKVTRLAHTHTTHTHTHTANTRGRTHTHHARTPSLRQGDPPHARTHTRAHTHTTHTHTVPAGAGLLRLFPYRTQAGGSLTAPHREAVSVPVRRDSP